MANKREGRENLATEILSDMKRRLIGCRFVLIISLAGNVIQAAMWFIR